jgi:hypothetical protein
MQSPATYQTSLTLPTGATTGLRITISGGAITGFYADGNRAWFINPTQGFTSLVDGVNPVQAYAQLNAGGLRLGSNFLDGVNKNNVFMGYSSGASGSLEFLVQDASTVQHQMLLENTPGSPSPFMAWATDSAGWTALSLNAAGLWTTSSTYNGFGGNQSISSHIDAEDNVWLYGTFHGGISPNTKVGTLTSSYFPSHTANGYACFEDGGGGSSVISVFVDTTGNVFVERSVAAARNYQINMKFPRGNIV